MNPGRTIRLADGRALFVATHGPVTGHPVLYCHGTPSAHSEWGVFGDDALLERLQLRIIAPDRPGFGASDFQAGRTLASWPADAGAILDACGIERFSVLGYSGGGAYAVATALAFAGRVDALGLVAPVIHVGPDLVEGLDPQGLRLKELARTRPWLARIVLSLAMRVPARIAPGRLAATLRRTLPAVDGDALDDDRRMDRFIAVIRDAFHRGARGPAHDMGLMVSPWDIELRPATFPVEIWQGELDNFGARPAMARHLQAALVARKLHLSADGHVSIFTRNVEAILAGLAVTPGRESRPAACAPAASHAACAGASESTSRS